MHIRKQLILGAAHSHRDTINVEMSLQQESNTLSQWGSVRDCFFPKKSRST